MKNTLLAVSLLSCPALSWSQASLIGTLDFDKGAAFALPALKPGSPADLADANHTPETEMIKEVKSGIIEILVVVKWSDVKDEFLPIDTSKLPPAIAAIVGEMTDEEIKELEAKGKKKLPRVPREKLGGASAVASGTGFLIKTPDGRVVGVTNAHVVSGVDMVAKKMHAPASLHVKLADDPYATVVSADDMTAQVGAVGKRGMDIALLSLPAKRGDGQEWKTLGLADSAEVEEGEEVWAMGFPMGLAFTTTHGIVSAVHVTLDNAYVSYIQTDAAINPGNSGGPLLHMTGDKRPEVVAMNTQIMTESGGSQGLGFAIEANTIKRALAQYAKTGSIDVGYVGVTFGPGKGADKDKIVILTVAPGGPAAKAGVKPGDVVKRAGGQTLAANPETGMFQLSRAVKAQDPGGAVDLTLARGGKEFTVVIKVEKEPADFAAKEDAAHAAQFPDGN